MVLEVEVLDEPGLALVDVDRAPVGLVVDGGPLPGAASTVVEVPATSGGPAVPRVLRTGPIDAATIAELWRRSVK